MIDLGRIDRITECTRRIQNATEELAGIPSPPLGARDVLLDVYKRMYGEAWGKAENTRVFLFVYIYHFAPATLVSGRYRRNSRKHLISVLGLRSPQNLSVRSRNLLFCYRTFPAFRKKVDALQSAFESELEARGDTEA